MCVVIFLFMLLGAAAVFYESKYKKFDFNAKLVCKAIIIYFCLGFTGFMVALCVSVVSSVAEEVKDEQLPSRLRYAELFASDGDYGWLAESMEINMDYEEEFECYWERIIMDEVVLRYRIYKAAAEAKAGDGYEKEKEKYEELVKKHCMSPAYAENIPYGEYFMELAGYQ